MVDNLPIGALTKEVAGILKGRVGRFSIRQVDLEAVFGVNQSQVSKILRGERALTVDQLEAACWALDLDFDKVVQDAWDLVVNYGEVPDVPGLVRDNRLVGSSNVIPMRSVSGSKDAQTADELFEPDISPTGAKRAATPAPEGEIAGDDVGEPDGRG